ncbi:hypothetical protein Ae406Ps2_3177 [Pseudonocardia sp. Ae406_Ps2]|uniref:hypothetical protein n=1 Tax=unclassified Pseudonocardia TaxID=2619320 RepID=UPI00094B43B3|nr:MULTISPECIES: hypothetical protein [unclassified Pseudonocardia]OLL99082.1 hypothetical protein Ae331Ps2_2749c [Pseudonocardia sp. Ae331_Ps2]OLM03177.1 hypothetical protein Ae406Ps2_3177 [Pseudonocardia sp. Ae406_Ps2]OLM11947.1 hypothetical protein Ae505Ps2_2073c [Pseudonocardia sp. Ae505_Ps2]OLM24735.1 hypothetical protein Ae706Ps2_3168 [Pseudonocardia sp. Ae706_Ps2]OLM29331.1 hypothetical protein Ae717Ps2_0224c [Pseudonocardia sp. Ae717_Ps2]
MRRSLPLLVLAAVLAVPLALLVPALLPGPPSQAVLTSADRDALGDPGPVRGPEPAVPATRPSSPGAVARAYLVAAHGTGAGAAGGTTLDGTPYALPGSPAAAGAPVLDPPPPGSGRTAEVEDLDEGATDWARGRTALVATVRTTTSGPGTAPEVRRWRTRVVLALDAAGHWLVTADTPITTDTPDVDD